MWESLSGAQRGLISKPVLIVVNPTKKFVLQTDASEKGLGAVLSQVMEEGEENPITYASIEL